MNLEKSFELVQQHAEDIICKVMDAFTVILFAIFPARGAFWMKCIWREN